LTISLTTPSKLRELQSKLYRKAKNEFPVPSRGTRPSAMKWCLGTRSPAASSCPIEPSFVSLAVKPVGKPDAGNPHVRFDERGWETGRRFGVSARAHPRLYKSARQIMDNKSLLTYFVTNGTHLGQSSVALPVNRRTRKYGGQL
jgi:hypothetical protein